MNDNTVIDDTRFTEEIKHLQQRVLFKYSNQFILYALCFFLLLHGLILAAEKSGLHRFERDPLFYLSFGAIILLATSIGLYLRKSSLLYLLIEIDSRLDLQDRLSTAYEYHLAEKKSIFSADLLEDAVRSLNRFSRRELLPLNFSRLYLVAALLFSLNLLLLVVGAPDQDRSSTLNAQATEREREKDAAQTPEQRKQEDKRLREEKKNEEGYERLREKAETLRQTPLPQQERARKLQEMLQEVQGMQEGLMDSASAGDESIDLENMPIREVPQQQRRRRSSLQNIEELLQNMLSKDASGAFDGSSELSPELQEQLSELMEDLEEQQFDSSQEAQKGDTGAEDSESSSGASADREDGQNGKQEESDGDGNDESSSPEQLARGMSEAGREGDMDDPGQMEGDEFQAAIGSGTSDGEEYSPSTPETSDNPVQKDRVQTSEQEQYNAHIRSVTKIGKARLPEENPARPYRREVESVLLQEEMPLNYREYIKNYFLSIGLTEE